MNNVKISKLQLLRFVVQLVFIVLLIMGLYMKVRILGFILGIVALVMGNFFCGWMCPFGTAQDFFGRVGSLFVKKKYKMPKSIQKYLVFSRYIIVLIILLQLLPKNSFLFSEMNAYRNFFKFVHGDLLSVASVIVLSFLLISMFFERPFCNYFCTEGVRYGINSLTRVFTIQRSSSKCVNCKKCDQACPMNIQISTKDHVRSAQCINCLECISSCPVKETLKYEVVDFKKIKSKIVEKIGNKKSN